jgi:hypothetical protein
MFLSNFNIAAPNQKETTQLDDVDDENTLDDDDIVLGPFVCLNKERHEWGSLVAQELAAYCKPKYRFHGVSCAECSILFVDKNAGKERFKPSSKTLMWHCKNAEDDCTYALCCYCYDKISVSCGDKKKRTRS